MIFSELEQKNSPEIAELKKKYGFTNIQPNLPVFPTPNKKNKMNLNMNTFNLNFNNFNMNYAFNNNKTFSPFSSFIKTSDSLTSF